MSSPYALHIKNKVFFIVVAEEPWNSALLWKCYDLGLLCSLKAWPTYSQCACAVTAPAADLEEFRGIAKFSEWIAGETHSSIWLKSGYNRYL